LHKSLHPEAHLLELPRELLLVLRELLLEVDMGAGQLLAHIVLTEEGFWADVTF
jgi:hypothetical protein